MRKSVEASTRSGLHNMRWNSTDSKEHQHKAYNMMVKVVYKNLQTEKSHAAKCISLDQLQWNIYLEYA